MCEQVKLTEQQKKIISKIPLFNGIDDELKLKLLEKLDYSVFSYEKGKTIIHQDTSCKHLLILLKGKLDVYIIDITGNNFKVEDIIAPRAFATPHLFGDNNIFPATFTTTENSILLRATKDSVFELISSEPHLLKNFLRVTGNCNACTVSRLRILSYKSIRSRFIYYLQEHKVGPSTSQMEHNQTQLAEYLGVTRPALAKEIGKLVKEELITVDGKEVQLLDMTNLLQSI